MSAAPGRDSRLDVRLGQHDCAETRVGKDVWLLPSRSGTVLAPMQCGGGAPAAGQGPGAPTDTGSVGQGTGHALLTAPGL